MNTEHIPKEILDNPNINLSDNNIKDIIYLNDTFKELKRERAPLHSKAGIDKRIPINKLYE